MIDGKTIGTKYVIQEENVSPEIKGDVGNGAAKRYYLVSRISKVVNDYVDNPDNFFEIRKNFKRDMDKNPDSFKQAFDTRLSKVKDIKKLEKAYDYLESNRVIQGIKEIRK